MNIKSKLLLGLLVGQIFLAGVFFLNRRGSGAFESSESLLGIEKGDYDKVTITEPLKPPLTLTYTDGKWVIPERAGIVVSPEKMAQTIEKLVGLKKSWPVADTTSAQKRLKVSETEFEKKVVFFRKEKEKETVYVGSSPEFRKAHLRPADSKKIVLEEFSAHELSTNPTDWEVNTSSVPAVGTTSNP
ncbi:MAG: DUF4340 domain-containing protein [Elusimicrobia bacterium]|nr:DUF4340 domain-containing protein [Elusimicrobiota bacterium]